MRLRQRRGDSPVKGETVKGQKGDTAIRCRPLGVEDEDDDEYEDDGDA
jgi:hypothetical protein